jgi:hypothetical protein
VKALEVKCARLADEIARLKRERASKRLQAATGFLYRV